MKSLLNPKGLDVSENMLDIANPRSHVSVEMSKSSHTLWVNVDGMCALRVTGIPQLCATFLPIMDGKKEVHKEWDFRTAPEVQKETPADKVFYYSSDSKRVDRIARMLGVIPCFDLERIPANSDAIVILPDYSFNLFGLPVFNNDFAAKGITVASLEQFMGAMK